jgi:hypothetical protein
LVAPLKRDQPSARIPLCSCYTRLSYQGLKKILYQDVWRLPEYYWFDPETLELAGFRLVDSHYQPIEPTAAGYLPSQQLELLLGIHENKLRWFTAEGELIPLPEEAERQKAEQERQRADQEQQSKEQLLQHLDQLQALLRSQGIDPDLVP